MKRENVPYGEMSLSERWAACAVGMGTGLLPYMINGYISYFFMDVMLIPANSLVIFMFLARIFDGVQDIGIGLVVDRIRRPEGQCRPFFKWFAVPFLLASILLFLNPPLGATGKLIYAFVMYIAALFMISFLQLPYSAQVSLLTKDSRKITTLSNRAAAKGRKNLYSKTIKVSGESAVVFGTDRDAVHGTFLCL